MASMRPFDNPFVAALAVKRRNHFFRRPFKGHSFYEWQVGPVVFQWKHNLCATRFRRIHVWVDSYWRW